MDEKNTEPVKMPLINPIDLKDAKEEKEKEKETSPIEEARYLLEENTKVLIALTEERKKIEKAAANMMLGGKGFVVQQQPQETEHEKWKREAKERYKGTGLDPT
jgi:hypothetical protein